MNKELKFNMYYDKNGDDLESLVVDALLNFLSDNHI